MTTEWDDALLFEVAVDPFQQIASSGKEEGRDAGRRDGYLEGVNIGRSKGWEIGLELGYIQDFAQGILDAYEQSKKQQGDDGNLESPGATEYRTSHRLERCLTLARDVIKLIDEFPDPDSLLAQSHEDDTNSTNNDNDSNDEGCKAKAKSDGKCGKIDSDLDTHHGLEVEGGHDGKSPDSLTTFGKYQTSSSGTQPLSAMLDISASQERIRAKFKLLCVLLKTKQQFDLKRILDLGIDSPGVGAGADATGIEGASNGDLLESMEEYSNGRSVDVSLNDKAQKDNKKKGLNKGIGNVTEKDSKALESDW